MEKQEMVFGGPPARQRDFLRNTFNKVMQKLGFTDETYFARARVYFQHYAEGLNELELAAMVVQHLRTEMDFDVFNTAMKIMGVTVSLQLDFLTLTAAEEEATKALHQFFDKDIEALGATIRATNVLKAENILQFGELARLTEKEVLRFPNMGRHSLEHLKDAMRVNGMSFETDTKGWKSRQDVEREKKEAEIDKSNHAKFDRVIAILGLDSSTSSSLRAVGVFQVGQLIELGENGVRKTPNIGTTRLRRIIKALEGIGLHFGVKLNGWKPTV